MNVQFAARTYMPRFSGTEGQKDSSREVTLNKAELDKITPQFETLADKIEAGEYQLTATKEGERVYEDTNSTLDRYTENSTLKVTVVPSEGKPDASIKKIEFELEKRVRGKQGCFGGPSETGYFGNKLRIELTNGTTYLFDHLNDNSSYRSEKFYSNDLLSTLAFWGNRKAGENAAARRAAEKAKSAQGRAQVVDPEQFKL
jgi:hypothetical protein